MSVIFFSAQVQARFGCIEEGGTKQELRRVLVRKAYGRYMVRVTWCDDRRVGKEGDSPSTILLIVFLSAPVGVGFCLLCT